MDITCFILLLLAYLRYIHGLDRVHYIAIEEVEWDYAPSGKNLIEDYTLDDDADASVFTKQGETRIGKVYTKALYIEYIDDTYTTTVPKPDSLGFMGPALRAEVGDRIIVHAINNANYNFSLHPHGTFYTKTNEGALYSDKTSGTDKDDDHLEPGQKYTYTWEAREQHGPGPGQPNCNTFVYHSHADAPADTNSGLFGPLIICRPGTLEDDGSRTDVDQEIFLIFTVIDENMSWYLDSNIQKCGNPSSVDKNDDDFIESNMMHGINGLLYGNLKGLNVCQGDSVALHVIGLGNEIDVHTAYFQGQTLTYNVHTEDTFNLFPASFSSAEMQANSGVGMWRVSCLTNDHYSAGMQAILNVSDCGYGITEATTLATKHFYIVAEDVEWNYAPSGMDQISNTSITENPESKIYFEQRSDRIGGTYKKAMYTEYTNDTFVTKKAPVSETSGILGPLIMGEVGDMIKITYKNNASFVNNIEPHAVYIKSTEDVQPGNTTIYEWIISKEYGPKENDSDCITLMYASMTDPVKDTNTGLVGPLLICKKGTLDEYLKEKTYYILMTIFDENLSHYINDNIASYANKSVADDADFVESNKMTSINGYMYGNLLGIDMCLSESTNFRVIGLGTEGDIHGFYVEGVPVVYRTERVGVLQVLPHTTYFVTLTPEVIGSNYIGCYLLDHIEKGMLTTYQAMTCNTSPTTTTTTSEVIRMFNISVEEQEHDYDPSRLDIFGNSVDDPSSSGYTFAHQEDGERIGTKYIKAMYFEYDSDLFTKKIPKPDHLGSLGPIIYGEEGDTIEITFKNMANRTYNIFGRGLAIESEMIGEEISALAGETVRYTWVVPSSAVPGDDKPECQSELYLSTVDTSKDVYSGLVGPLITCRKGSIKDGILNRTHFLLFLIMNENDSHYIDQNLEEYANVDASSFDKTDPDFVESNLMHSMNGVIFTLPGLNLTVGEEYLWHVAAYGVEIDLHTVHFHGNLFQHYSDVEMKSDVFPLIPGNVATLIMTPDAPGNWILHCHVDDHIYAGMETTYFVAGGSRMIIMDLSVFICSLSACICSFYLLY